MINTDVKASLVNYHEIKKAIQIDKKNLEIIRYKKTKVGGSIAKRKQNSISRDELILVNMETEDRYLLELTNHQYWLYLADNFINHCNGELKRIIIDLYIKKTRMEEVISLYAYSKSQIHRKINDEVDAFVKLMNEKQL